MTDEELIEQFENCTLPKSEFRHRAHVRLAWLYLNRYSGLEAITRFTEKLKSFAHHLGAPDLYHETITWGHLFLIHERIFRAPAHQTWEDFAAANGDILNWQDGIFKQHYSDELLASDIAGKIFVLPDCGKGKKIKRRKLKGKNEER